MRKILIAGASGFIGRALIDQLLNQEDIQIVALSRGSRESHHPKLIWKKCDLFSMKDISMAMEGCNEAWYLVRKSTHSAILTQGSNADFELLMADNFIKMARLHNISLIHYSSSVSDEIKGMFRTSGIRSQETDQEQKNSDDHFESYTPEKKTVRSIQRLVLPEGRNAEWVALEYFKWLPTFFSTLVKVSIVGNRCVFYLFDPAIQILILEKSEERSSPERQLLYVVGGLLAGPMERGRLEFREVLDRRYVMAALHEFRPALPWYVYRWTQAIVHLIVMKAFGEHLKWHVISQKKVSA